MTKAQLLYDKISEVLLGLGGCEYDDGDALVTEVGHDGKVSKIFLSYDGELSLYSQDPALVSAIANNALRDVQCDYTVRLIEERRLS
jgi:hypothetical protein